MLALSPCPCEGASSAVGNCRAASSILRVIPQALFSAQTASTRRADQLWRWDMAARPPEPELVLAEPDPAFHLALSKTRSDRFLLLYGHSEVTMYVKYLAADHPQGRVYGVLGLSSLNPCAHAANLLLGSHPAPAHTAAQTDGLKTVVPLLPDS